jgi:hypothetical protein
LLESNWEEAAMSNVPTMAHLEKNSARSSQVLQPFYEWLRKAENIFARLVRRRSLSVTVVGASAFLFSAALSLLVRFPEPAVHDEFSYLLAADTFEHGRLTNPTHPMWIHFETMHIIQQPTYASKYPPAQGLFLAAGKVIGGHPIVGVWLSTAFGCAAICWMLMGWLTPRWAFLGGMLAVIHPLILGWGQGYWGGAVAMAGGALVVGAFRRLVRYPRRGDALVMGAGIAVLANSRPYEGMILSLLLLVALLFWMGNKASPPARVWFRRVVLPLALVLAANGGWMAYYNFRITGNALRMPYLVHESTYKMAPPFLWQNVKPEPVYRHKELRDFYVVWDLPFYDIQHSVSGILAWSAGKILLLLIAYFRVIGLAVPIAALPLVVERSRWMRLALLICGLFAAGLLLETYVQLHYAAPILGLVFLVVVQSMRHLRLWRWRGWRTGRAVVAASLILCTVSFIAFCKDSIVQAKVYQQSWSAQRASLLRQLAQGAERHLVIVRYRPEHSPHNEWVFNAADIDNAKVVWAREMDETQNRQIIDYFSDRRIWLLEADAETVQLSPYKQLQR